MWKKTCMFMVSMKPSTIIVKFMVVESGVRTKGGLISPFNEKVLVLNKKNIYSLLPLCQRWEEN